MALERYEMQIHKSEFKPLSFDNSFKLEIASSFNGNTKKHFENILSSIDTRLSDWIPFWVIYIVVIQLALAYFTWKFSKEWMKDE